MPLPPAEVNARIEQLSERGDALASAGNYNAALERYRAAFALLPAPAERHRTYQWLLAAMADAHFHRGDWGGCRQNLRDAIEAGGGENAFVRLRLGQAELALGDEAAAERHLFEAFRLGGEEVFEVDGGIHLEWLRRRV